MKNQMAVQIGVERTSNALVVDDGARICEYLSEVLKDFGMNVHCAQTVREALEIARTDVSLDVAFVDLNCLTAVAWNSLRSFGSCVPRCGS